jgi:hypothetical protein
MVVRIGNTLRAELAENGKEVSLVHNMLRFWQYEDSPEKYFDEIERRTAAELERVTARLEAVERAESRHYNLREY